MRGRKLDSDFICKFIKECAERNKSSVEDVINEAKLKIENIDSFILKAEKLKIKRKQLFDVILSFEDKIKEVNNLDLNMIAFSKITNHNICGAICKLLIKDIDINNLYALKYDRQEIIFYIKQMIENQIIKKNNNIIYRADNFDDYLLYLSRKP